MNKLKCIKTCLGAKTYFVENNEYDYTLNADDDYIIVYAYNGYSRKFLKSDLYEFFEFV